MSKKQVADFETTVCGIPCGVVVESYVKLHPFSGSPHLCDSDMDYYGYTETEWHLIDRKGYQADWLQKKMSDNDIEQLTIEIEEDCNE